MDGLKAIRPCIHDAMEMGEAWKIKHRWGYEELNNNGYLLFIAMDTHGGMPSPTHALAPGGTAAAHLLSKTTSRHRIDLA